MPVLRRFMQGAQRGAELSAAASPQPRKWIICLGSNERLGQVKFE
jgi:hypothetical protein